LQEHGLREDVFNVEALQEAESKVAEKDSPQGPGYGAIPNGNAEGECHIVS
jgi:hypothetical protein